MSFITSVFEASFPKLIAPSYFFISILPINIFAPFFELDIFIFLFQNNI